MPQDNTQKPQMQPATPMSQNNQNQGKQEINPEKMLLQFLKELEQNVMDLSQRVDVLEQGLQ